MSEWRRGKWVVSESPDRLPRIVVEVEGEPTLMVSDRVFNGFAQLIVDAVNAYLSSDILENLEGASLEELRTIRKALGHDVEASEREFLEMIKRWRSGRRLLKHRPTLTAKLIEA